MTIFQLWLGMGEITNMKRSDFDRQELKHAVAIIEDQILAADMITLRGIQLLLNQLQDKIHDNIEALAGG